MYERSYMASIYQIIQDWSIPGQLIQYIKLVRHSNMGLAVADRFDRCRDCDDATNREIKRDPLKCGLFLDTYELA